MNLARNAYPSMALALVISTLIVLGGCSETMQTDVGPPAQQDDTDADLMTDAATPLHDADLLGDAQSGPPLPAEDASSALSEVCNGLDDDGDGNVDEETVMGQPCMDADCSGTLNCNEARGAFCELTPVEDDDECNGVDDDCDGNIDESFVCGAYVQDHCRLWIGWSDGYAVTNRLVTSELVVDTWGDCPEMSTDFQGAEVCVGTDRTPRFRRLKLPSIARYRANYDDEAGIAFGCEDNQNSQLAQWVSSHCTVYLGHTVNAMSLPALEQWGLCPDGLDDPQADRDEAWKCTASQPDGRFRMMDFSGSLDMGQGDILGIAFRCEDASNPALALSMTTSVEVHLAWADDDGEGFPQDLSLEWLDDDRPCPAESAIEAGLRRCVSSNGDGLFHALHLGGTVDGASDSTDVLGIALRQRTQE